MSFEEKDSMLVIAGAGSTGGESHTPYEEPDNLQSSAFINVVDLIGEGQIGGLVDASRSIFLNGTALVGSDGSKNYESVSWDARVGTQNQTHLEGFANVETPYGVGVEMKTGIPVPFTVSNPRVDRVRLSMAVSALLQQKDNGDVIGSSVDFEIRMSINDGAFETLATKTITGKASSRYQRSYLIDLPKTAPNGRQATRWTFQIIRVSPESTSASLQNTLVFENYAEVINRNFTYPNSAIVGMRFDAEAFSSVPKREYLVDGLLIKVPNNYDPVTRKYSGVWNGGFKLAATSNPAWILYDLLLNKRYGLGEYIDVSMIDETKLYQIGQYCDQLVDDGFGNKEPRYTINCVVNKRAEAYDLITDICTCFNGMGFWAGDQVSFMIDAPSDPVMAFTTANIIGEFTYTGSSLKDRHSIVAVTWNDPSDNYKQVVEYVEDPDLIERYGVRKAEIQAFGCTSRGQAHRVGRWLLYTEHYQSEVINFKAGLDSALVMPGDLIQIQDEDRSGKRMGGRLIKCEKKTAWLDDALDLNGLDQLKFAVLLEDGKFAERKVTSYTLDEIEIGSTGRTKKVTKVSWATDLEKDPVPQAVWVLSSPNLEPVLARVVNVRQGEEGDTVEISAIPHNPSKYLAIENDMMLEVPITSILDSRKQEAPKEVRIKQEIIKTQGIAKTRLVIDWDQAKGASKYRAEWKRDEGNWIPLPDTSNLSAEVDDIFAGIYTARVRAENIFGAASYYTYSKSADLQGKTGTLANVGAFNVTGVLFGYEFEWIYPSNSEDYAYVEIQSASLSDHSDAKLFAHIAYPTNTHSVTGLQGNLTTYFRIKCVDKAGNESEWSEWVEAITDANPEKVLEVLEGHINESTLDAILSGKINSIEEVGRTAEEALEAAEGALIRAQEELSEAVEQLTNDQSVALAKEAADRAAAIAAEASARAAAIAAEAEARIASAEATLNDAVSQANSLINSAVGKEATDRAAAILAEANARAKAITDKAAEINADVAAKVKTLNDGITQEVKDRKEGDTAVLGELNAYKLSNDGAVAAVLEKAELAISNDSVTAEKVSSLQSSLDTVSGEVSKKLDATAISNYYTKTQADSKAAEIAAGKIEDFNAKLVIGGRNLYSGPNPIIWANHESTTGELISNTASTENLQLYRYMDESWLDLADVSVGDDVITSMEIMIPSDSVVLDSHQIRMSNYRFGASSYKYSPLIYVKDLPRDKWIRLVVPAGKFSGTNVTSSKNISISLYLYGREIGTKIKWRNLMIEKATTPSAFVESGKAVQQFIDANAEAIKDTNAKVVEVDGQVKSQATDISTLRTDLTAVDAKAGSAIDAAAEAQRTANTAVDSNSSLANTVETLTANFEKSATAGANLLVNSNVQIAYNGDGKYPHGKIDLGVDWEIGETYTLLWCATHQRAEGDTKSTLSVYAGGGTQPVQGVSNKEKAINKITFTKTEKGNGKFLSIYLLNKPENGVMTTAIVHWAVLVKGDQLLANEWIPSAFDYQAAVTQTNATITSVQTALANADKALGERIDTVQTKMANDKTEVTGKIETVESSVTTLEGNINNKLTALESNIDTKLGQKANATALNNYYTKTQTEGKALEIAAGEVNKFSAGLVIGAKNLLPNSNFANELTDWEGPSSTVSVVVDAKNKFKKVAKVVSTATSAGLKLTNAAGNAMGLESDTEYTFSGWVRAAAAMTVYPAMDGSGTVNALAFAATTEWQYFVLTRRLGDNRIPRIYGKGEFYLANLQIERGNKATDWSESSADIQNSLKANADAISNTYTKTQMEDKALEIAAGEVNKFNASLVLGGHNLIPNSAANFRVGAVASSNASLLTREIQADGTLKVTCADTFSSGYISNWQGASTTFTKMIEELRDGEDFTVTVWLKAADLEKLPNGAPTLHLAAGISYLAMNGDVSQFASGKEVPFSHVRKWLSSVTFVTPHINFSKAAIGGGVVITKWKIERGNKSTDWSVADADVLAAIDANAEAIKNTYTKTQMEDKALEIAAGEVSKYNASLQIGGTNLIDIADVQLLGISSTIVTNKAYRGFTLPVQPGEVYSISRPAIETNRFRYCFTSEPPAADVAFTGQVIKDTALKFEGIVIPEGAAYLFLYLSNAGETVTKIKVERGHKATDWSESPNAVQRQLDANATAINDTNVKVTEVEGNVSTHASQISGLQANYAAVDAKAGTAISNAATAQRTAETAVNASQSTASSLNKLEAKFESSRDSDSLVADYLMKDPNQWVSHYNYDLSGYFVTVTDGKIGNTVFRKSEANNCWNYGLTILPKGKYKLSMWVRRTADSSGSLYFTARVANGANPNFTSGRYISNNLSSSLVPATNEWTLVEKVWDVTSMEWEQFQFGFAIGHGSGKPTWEMQGFKVAKVISDADTDGSFASNASLNTIQNTLADADKALGTRIDNLTTTVSNDKTEVKGLIKEVSDSVTTLEGNTNNKITQLESSMNTKLNSKADATALNNYYTKTQMEDKAATIAAGKVEEFSAALSVGGNNLFSLKNVKNYVGGNLNNAAYYTVTGRQVKRSGGGSSDRIGNEIAIKDPAKGLILQFTVVSGTVDNVLYYRCLDASGTQVKAQATVTGTRSGDVVTCKIPAASIPATTAKMNIGFGGGATTYTVTDVVVANASVAPEWSANIDDVDSVISTNAQILSETKALAEDVDGRVKTQTSSINSLTSRTTAVETQVDQTDQLARMLTSGKLMYADPTFKTDMSNVSRYGTGMSAFTMERVTKSSDNPTTSTHEVRLRVTDEATSRLGGFVQSITSRANAVFLMKYIIKLPVGLKLVTAANSLGTGSSDKFIGSVDGTGNYETYYRITKCGTGGTFSSGGHVYATRVSGSTLPTATADAPIDWFLASVETYDTTDYEDVPPAVRTTLANYQQSINTLTQENTARVQSINNLNTELGKKASTSSVSALEGSVSDINGKVNANTSAINSLKGLVGDKSIAEVLNNYYTKNAADTAIAGQVKAFSSKLTAVGANQILNSEAERTSTASSNREYLMYESSAHLKAFYDANLGQDITISCEIKVPVAGTVQIYSSNSSAHNWAISTPSLAANTWTKVEVTVKPAKHPTTPTSAVSTLEFYGVYNTGRIPTVRKVQMEAGSIATAWAPSLRDTNATLSSHATAIDNTYTKAETNSAISTSVNNLKSTLETAIGKKADSTALSNYYTKAETDNAVAGKVETIKASLDVASSALRIVGTQGVIDGLKGAASAIANLSIVADSTAKNGFVLRAGDNSGNDQTAVALGTMMQIDPEKTYRIRARFKRVQGEGSVYMGLNCVNATKTNVINKANSAGSISNVGASDHYTVSATAPALGTWTETVHYFKGKSTGSAGGSGTLASPYTFAAQAAYFAPMFIANYSGKAGITDFDYIVVEDAEAIVSGIDNATEIGKKLDATVIDNYYTKTDIDNTVIAGKLTTFQTSVMNPAIEAAKKNVDSLVIPDTRSTNQAPSWYWTNYPKKTVTEFKSGSSIGSPGGITGYGTLTTVVPWTDSSGGAIRQIFESGDSINVATRYSTSTTAWSAWQTDLKTMKASVTEATNVIDGVKAIKTVTIDNNGVLSGYGLISELVNGNVTSAFGINADNFYIGAPSSGKKPFIVTTTSKTINGTTYPAGTWIDSAYIANATIKTAHIDDGAITNAKISGAIQSNDYVANSKGWKIDKAGTIQINGSGTNGRVEITDKGLRIYNASGVVVVEVGLF